MSKNTKNSFTITAPTEREAQLSAFTAATEQANKTPGGRLVCIAHRIMMMAKGVCLTYHWRAA